MEPDNPLHNAWLEIMAFIPSKLLNTPQDCIFDGTLCHDIYTVDGKVGVASILDHGHPFSIQISGTSRGQWRVQGDWLID